MTRWICALERERRERERGERVGEVTVSELVDVCERVR